MARLAVADGIVRVLATPHQLGFHGRNQGPEIRKRSAQLQERLDQAGIGLAVLPGAEVRVEPGLLEKLASGEVLSLADHRRHVLLELPHEVCLPLERMLLQLRAAGLTAILAHPERNAALLAQPLALPALVRAGCLVQITAASLMGAFGAEVERFACRLVEQGLAHFVATDAHGMQSRRPLLARAMDRVCGLMDEATAARLCCTNPARIAAGGIVEPFGAARPAGRAAWFSWRRAA